MMSLVESVLVVVGAAAVGTAAGALIGQSIKTQDPNAPAYGAALGGAMGTLLAGSGVALSGHPVLGGAALALGGLAGVGTLIDAGAATAALPAKSA